MKYVCSLALLLLPGLRSQGQSGNPIVINLHTQLKNSQPDTNRVKLLLLLGREYIFKKGELTADLDSALLLAHQAEGLSRTLHYNRGIGNSYLTTAQALREKEEKPKGRWYAQKAITVFKQLADKRKLAEIYFELGHSYWITKAEIPQKIYYNEQALSIIRELGDKKQEADLLKEIADLQQITGNYTEALRQLRQALTIYQSINVTDLTGIYDLLGFVSTKLGDFREGLNYGLRAVRITEQYKDTGLLACTVYNRVGLTYFAMSQYKQAYAYFKTAFSLAKTNNFNPSIIQIGGNISTVLVSLRQPDKALAHLTNVAHKYPPIEGGNRIHLAACFVDVYRELKQFGLAQRYCDEALGLSKKYGWESIDQLAMYQTIIRFFIASRQYNKAASYLALNESLCRQQGSPTELARNYLLRFQLDTTLHEYPLAIAHYQQFVTLKDSLFNETKSLQIAQLQIQYALQKKDHDLVLKEKNIRLLTNQSQLQKTQLQQANTTRKGIMAGAVMLTLLLGLSYNRYRLKQRSNQQLEAQQLEINQKNQSLEQLLSEKEGLLTEKEWMLKEIHHRVKNNLQVISSMLNAQSDFLSDPTALAAMRESQNRVHAMALIHQKLYQSESLALVNMPDYVHDIVEYLVESFDRQRSIHEKVDVAPLELDVTLATPLGLIINEVVTNSLKYAFPHNRTGTISVGLTPIDGQTHLLTIRDDGVGLPNGFDIKRSKTLGLTMIRGLSSQIGGQLRIDHQDGMSVSLQFSLAKKSAKPARFSI